MTQEVKNKKIRIFESSIEKLGRILSSKWNIKVVFKHDTCETNGNTIYLPVLPNNASSELMEAMQGYLDHEAAHVVFTDFLVLKKYLRFPKVITAINALEDLRIEKKWVELWRGARVNLHNSMEWALQKTAVEKDMDDPENPGTIKKMRPWDCLSDFGKFLKTSIIYASNDFNDKHWFLTDVVEPEIFNKVKSLRSTLEESLKAETTTDIAVLAERLLKELQEENDEIPQVNEEDVPDDAIILPPGAGQSPQDRAMFKHPPKDPNAPKVYQLTPGEDGVDDQEEESSQKTKPNFNPTDEEVAKDNNINDTSELLKEAANKSFSIDKDNYIIFSTENDLITKVKDGDRQKYKTLLQESVRVISPIKKKLSRSLLSMAVNRWEGDKTRGKINPRRLYQAKLGTSKRVFRQRVSSEGFDTAVLMMIDHSGSMAGSKLNLAAQSAIVLGEVLNQLDIPFGVYGFSTGDGNQGYNLRDKSSREEQRIYTRWDSHQILQYKGFEDSWANTNHKMVNMNRNQQYNTYDGESLRFGAQVLLQRVEKRKIFFWLNDGQPECTGADDHKAAVAYTRSCAKEVEKLVELFAIGIQSESVKEFYKNSVVINSINDLPMVCISELDQLIRQGKTLRG